MKLEPLFRAEIALAPPQEIGETPQGRRRVIAITGGRFAEARLSGRVLPAEDGALIYLRNRGLRHGAPEVLARLAAGGSVDPRLYYIRTTPLLEAGDERYAWLELDVFEVQ